MHPLAVRRGMPGSLVIGDRARVEQSLAITLGQLNLL